MGICVLNGEIQYVPFCIPSWPSKPETTFVEQWEYKSLSRLRARQDNGSQGDSSVGKAFRSRKFEAFPLKIQLKRCVGRFVC